MRGKVYKGTPQVYVPITNEKPIFDVPSAVPFQLLVRLSRCLGAGMTVMCWEEAVPAPFA